MVVKRSPRLGDTHYFLSEDWHKMLATLCVRAQPEEERCEHATVS